MRPRIGISRCLLGDEVRYDGTHKQDLAVLDAFDGLVEWVPVCPEVEVGMGTPREPIQIIGRRLVGVQSGEDWTLRMRTWAEARVQALRGMELSGFVLKARSPSCDPEEGFFAQVLLESMPGLPVADEDQLHDARAREAFLARVRRSVNP